MPIGAARSSAQVWRVDVGRVPLFLLDAERPENDAVGALDHARGCTPAPATAPGPVRCCSASAACARSQAMGIDPAVVHLNEGHAAFVSLELARREASGGASLDDALAGRAPRTVFTTHTPVPAGNDTYPPELVASRSTRSPRSSASTPDRLVRLGRTSPDQAAEPFGVTQFALRTSRAANGVSRRHGEVAREMWQGCGPTAPSTTCRSPTSRTASHLPTWVGGPMRDAARPPPRRGLDRPRRGPGDVGRARRHPRRGALGRAQRDSAPRSSTSSATAAAIDRLGRDEPLEYVAGVDATFDPDVLTIGFARRLATYKRLHLLVADAERSQRPADRRAPRSSS